MDVSGTGIESARVADRDTSTGIAVATSTSVSLRFGHEVEVRKVKVHGAASLRVEAGGAVLGEPDAAGWAVATLSTPVTSSELRLSLTPTGHGARFDEVEVWGAGRDVGPRSIDAIANATKGGATPAWENVLVLRASPDSAALRPVGMLDGSPCFSAHFPAFEPRQARRAFLVFEANVPRGVVLQHSLNGEAPVDGIWLGSTTARRTLVDEVDAERLRGGDGLQVCLPEAAAGAVEVTGLRLVLILDDGSNGFDREAAMRFGQAVDGADETAVTLESGTQVFAFDRPIDVEEAELRLGQVPAHLLGIATRRDAVWTDWGAMDVTEPVSRLPVAGSADAIRVEFDTARGPSSVSELRFAGSGLGARVGGPRIVLAYPAITLVGGREVGERFGDRAFISGWAESPAGRGIVEVDGARVGLDGAFSEPLTRPLGSDGSWPVILRATFPDGSEVARTIYLDDDRESEVALAGAPWGLTDEQRYGREDRTGYGELDPATGGKLSLGTEVSIEAPPGAVTSKTSIGITRKGHEEIPALDAGMVNVTAPSNGAYRFLPRGQRFAKPVKVTIPYDPALVPEGVNAGEIRTYYFDEAEDRWIALALDQVDPSVNRVVSATDHFTFMINAVLVLPDHPGPASFNPNSIKDLKAADPYAGIDLVQPPEANNDGSARLSFPVRLPRGRGAYQPNVQLAYDSSGGNGWLGVGWSMPVSSIQVDTRWGVQDWSAAEQRYLLDGEQLVPTGEQGICEGTTSPGALYRERIVRDFRRVLRCGSGSTQWFEVSDRAGTLFVYGYGESARLRSPRAGSNVGQWFLERVVDTNANLTEFDYDTDMPTAADSVSHTEPFRQVYLRSIRYTGRAPRTGTGAVSGGSPGPYVVDFLAQTTNGRLVARPDVISSGRLGFKVVTRRLLDRIRVSLDPSPGSGEQTVAGAAPIREYRLTYGTSASTLWKSLLEEVRVHAFDASGRLKSADFFRHAFEYEQPDIASPFGASTIDWSFAEATDDDQAGRNEEEIESSAGGIGISFLGFSVGQKSSSSTQETFGQTALLDINGDGLLDRVRLAAKSDPAYVAFNAGLVTSGSSASGTFSYLLPSWDPAAGVAPGPLPYVLSNEFGQSKSESWNAGVLGLGAEKGSASGWSVSPTFAMDADGDGFPDIVSGGGIRRGKPRSSASPGFGFVGLAAPSDPSATLPGVEDDRRPSDVVLEWVAPFSGNVDVTGAFALVDRTRPATDPEWDGVRLRIYRADEEDGAFVTTLLHETTTDVTKVGTPEQVALTVSVAPGTRLHFVLSTLSDFPVELSTRSPLEETSFAPVITYQGATEEELTRLDPTGAPSHKFDAAADFRLAGGAPVAYRSPVAGTVHLETRFVKGAAGDDLRLCVQKFDGDAAEFDRRCDGNGFGLAGQKLLPASDVRTETWALDVEVGAGDQLVFRVDSDFAIDPAALEWTISGAMTRVCDERGSCGKPKESVAPQLSFLGDPYFPLHLPIDAGLSGATAYSARPDPRPLAPWIAPSAGTLEITTRQSTWSAPADAWIAGRTRTSLLFKQRASDAAKVVKVAVTAGQEIYFEGHGPAAAPTGWAPTVKYSGGSTLTVPLNLTQDAVVDGDGHRWALRTAYGGGYHGWRRGVWHGKNGEALDPGTFLVLLPYAVEGRGRELGAKLADPASAESMAMRLNSPLYPRWRGTRVSAADSGLAPDAPAFVSQDRTAFATATTVHASIEAVLSQGAGGMSRAPVVVAGNLCRASEYESDLYGLDLFGIAGLSAANGHSSQTVDALDMNGDRLLDRVSQGDDGAILVTDLHDTMKTRRFTYSGGLLRRSHDVSGSANIGERVGLPEVPADSAIAQAVLGTANVSAGVSMGVNLSSADRELIDVNGDGLPDRVHRTSCTSTGGECFGVQLNLGGVFGEEDKLPVGTWLAGPIDGLKGLLDIVTDDDVFTADQLRRTAAVTIQSSVGASFIVGYGKAWESSIASTAVSLVDVTGDGLPDYVRKGPRDGSMYVMVNRGGSFAPEKVWSVPGWRDGVSQPQLSAEGLFGGAASRIFNAIAGEHPMDALEANGSWNPEASESWGISATVPVGPFAISFGYSKQESTRETGLQLGMLDIDGDGFADHVLKTEKRDGESNDTVSVRLNRMSKANLLNRVVRPLGGSIELAYARAGHTVDMPEHAWVLEETIVRDGRGSGAGMEPVVGHDIRTRYAYEGGHYDRTEREFLGFGTVDRTNADGSHVVRTFRNDRLAFKGLLEGEQVQDAARRLLVETVNLYADPYTDVLYRTQSGNAACDARRPFMIGAGDYWCGSLFPALVDSRTHRYEGEPTARVTTRQTFLYDAFGNVGHFDDYGDVSAANLRDDLHAEVIYASDTLATRINSVSRPESLVVRDSGNAVVRRREAEYDTRGNLTRLVSYSSSGKSVDSLLTWDELGRLEQAQGPLVTSGRYTTTYAYDPVVGTYVVGTSDSHGYASSAEWDYRFGEATRTVDLNGNVTRRVLDPEGRVSDVYGPYDGAVATVHVDYVLGGTVPYAVTRNRLPEGGTLDTVVLADGLGRAIQTKKTAEVDGSGVGWSVSGHQTFDAMGRVASQGQTFFELGTSPGYRPGTPIHPRFMKYDALGRTTRTDDPIEKTGDHLDGRAVTTMSYGFGTAGTAITRLAATVTDPQGKVRVLFRDPADRVVAVEERNAGEIAITRYGYDAVGQLGTITDAGGNATTITYDWLGQRLSLDNPDAGKTSFVYDAAGNLAEKTDARNLTTRYFYDFDQLIRTEYPQSAAVTFEYGGPGAAENGAGRVIRVTDDAGAETRGYGKLGELVRSTRTVRPLRPGDVDKVFKTLFALDSYGRMRWIVYPDGEKVTYGYDAGGLLRSAVGERRATKWDPAGTETYLSSMTYDEQGQRRRVVLGNGAKTEYDYYPESQRLMAVKTVAAGRTLQALGYRYDRVGNVLGMTNSLPAPTGSESGAVSFEFGYDDLYRLTSATGTAESRRNKVDSFSASYGYDAIHNMTRNTQVHVLKTLGDPGVGTAFPPKTNHDFGYEYDPRHPHRAIRIGETNVEYDAAGNTVTECRVKDGTGSAGCGANADHLRRLYWTEENRLTAVVDGGGRATTRFIYDAAGDRVAKLGRGGESLTIGQFFSLKGRRAASKHIYAGAVRLATKMVPSPGWIPASAEVLVAGPDEPSTGSILPGCLTSEYQPQKCPSLPGADPGIQGPLDTKVKPATYYYHSDHLGSTSWVTDQNGKVHEHVEYFPYGEVWRDARGDRDGAGVKGQRFLFTGKELDEETGLYYFGARYYDPVRVRWASTDKADRFGRPEPPAALGLYQYALWAPTRLVDPTGNQEVEPKEAERIVEGPPEDVFSMNRLAVEAELNAELEAVGVRRDTIRAPEYVPEELELLHLKIELIHARVARDGRLAAESAEGEPGPGAATLGGRGRGGNQFRGPDPRAQGLPHSRFRTDPKGVTTYETYDHPEPGVGKRVDAVGPPHGSVPTPHTVDTQRHTNPRDPARSSVRESRPRPSTQDEVPRRSK